MDKLKGGKEDREGKWDWEVNEALETSSVLDGKPNSQTDRQTCGSGEEDGVVAVNGGGGSIKCLGIETIVGGINMRDAAEDRP